MSYCGPSTRPPCCALARGEAVNERPDWDNIIDEVESVGSEQLHAVECCCYRHSCTC